MASTPAILNSFSRKINKINCIYVFKLVINCEPKHLMMEERFIVFYQSNSKFVIFAKQVEKSLRPNDKL